MDISAKIAGIKYSPFLCRELNTYATEKLNEALSKDATFILETGLQNRIAISWWKSPKRTRSYPYARVYDSLAFQGTKLTIIPIMKDEGKEGDRDFLQWDTVSLMSLLDVYVIISYYNQAGPSDRYYEKITRQTFDIDHVKEEILKLLSYKSHALHWNLAQIEQVSSITKIALDSYDKISARLGIQMHSKESALKRIDELLKGKDNFMLLSRDLAKKAQSRESVTTQPKERLKGEKATLSIINYLGGYYFLTCDEVNIEQDSIYLIEGKYSNKGLIPSIIDIKDGLVKMILFTNIKEAEVDDKKYHPVGVLKLTSNKIFKKESLRQTRLEQLSLLKREAETNNFRIMINERNLNELL